jgi:hypothetical protein
MHLTAESLPKNNESFAMQAARRKNGKLLPWSFEICSVIIYGISSLRK